MCTQNKATKYKLISFVTILKNKSFILIVDCLIHWDNIRIYSILCNIRNFQM